MARIVYLVEHGPGSGKSAVALGLAELLSRKVPRIGVFRPFVDGAAPDPTLSLLRSRYHIQNDDHEPFGVTAAEAAAMLSAGDGEGLVGRIVERFRPIARDHDAVVVIGSDLDDEQSPTLALNARLANEFGAIVVAVVNGADLDADTVGSVARQAYHALVELDATVAAVVVNKSSEQPPKLPVPCYTIPNVATVAAPTVAEVATSLGATVLSAGPASLERDVLDYVVGAAQVPAVLSHLTDNCLLITPGDRADLLVAAAAAHASGTVPLAGIVLTLGIAPDPAALALFERLNTGLAVLSVPTASYDTIAASTRMEHRLGPDNPRKVAAALGAFESHVDTAALADALELTASTRVTPLMFEYDLIDRARAARKHLVLPEGTEERILRAADILLRRGVAALTLLGSPVEIAAKARDLGLDISDASVIDPATSPLLERFAPIYAELRAHKGVTLDLARDVVRDVSYFGTMMVHLGLADGMVSGATHTTAATIRPAFEIIKTVPGLGVASSVFFMLLPDRVLVYGDCAVNPDPDAEQLADIALSSATTAAQFGITARVAMLSYSTGTSGAGADVTKVASATSLVRSRRPSLPVEGPIQYDAAVDPSVAATKLPGSAVAGQATVFVFPDLNTGNNTYKAVQRSAGAVAVGPVMQGLRKPVNDLSRGATVKDIVNTVAITAIQAQGFLSDPSGTMEG
ncbi:phosphate acetyltransferase [Dactylosporangium siamense]|uniref:Phosphate acetyltransferase n=1 Tax=Dactylosporangium siamense TaxID=685454 RepID=A0A919PTL2_9ACTN|nr:phosphate acetyltransferase [Dactylosporangium siamense]GIG49472.1 phosphate acetyltransferase [Dactylosporangium siamense]